MLKHGKFIFNDKLWPKINRYNDERDCVMAIQLILCMCSFTLYSPLLAMQVNANPEIIIIISFTAQLKAL